MTNVSWPVIDEQLAWRILLFCRRRWRSGNPEKPLLPIALDAAGEPVSATDPNAALLTITADGRWSAQIELAAAAVSLFELYLPILRDSARGAFVIGHLGQSLDGKIATESGASHYINGPHDIAHLHRLRALADAIIVGANTVDRDDPCLTTRLVPGDNPTRVILDPKLRLPPERRVFTDAAAPTLVICREDCTGRSRLPDKVQLLGLPAARDGRLDLPLLVEKLRARRLGTLFVEGGGVTVSAFIQAGLLDRLHIAVAPLIIGSGKAGIRLPPLENLEHALRPEVRTFSLGDDLLFDCLLHREDQAG